MPTKTGTLKKLTQNINTSFFFLKQIELKKT